MEGGVACFPGLSKPVTIDSTALPAQELQKLQRLLSATHFYELSAAAGQATHSAPDRRRYTITLQEEGRTHTLSITEPIEDSHLQALINYLTAKIRVARSAKVKPKT